MNPFLGILAAGAMGMMSAMGRLFKNDQKEFHRRITGKGITDPREVWDECIDYHKKLREDLAIAEAKIKHAEELVRVAEGLHNLRNMMKDHDPPVAVKQSIISHWWTELMRLFVPWGLVIPEEIDTQKSKYFRLAGLIDPQRREAELRAYVFALKSANTVLRKDLDNLLGAIDEHGEIDKSFTDMIDPKRVTVRVRPDLVRSAMERYNEKTRVKEEDAKKWFEEGMGKAPDDLKLKPISKVDLADSIERMTRKRPKKRERADGFDFPKEEEE